MVKERRIINHHIQYAHPERKSMKDIVVKIYDMEHKVLTLMQWPKTFSKGFIKSLKVWLAMNEDEAIEI